MKKKAKPGATSTKPAKKKATKTENEPNPAEMRKSITGMVESEMESIGHAVVEEAKKGQLATVKYLFEVSGVYPASTEQGRAKPEDGETLARLLLTRLGLPLEPVISQDDEAEPRPKAATKQMRKHEDAAEETLEEPGARAERGADDGNEGVPVPVH